MQNFKIDNVIKIYGMEKFKYLGITIIRKGDTEEEEVKNRLTQTKNYISLSGIRKYEKIPNTKFIKW